MAVWKVTEWANPNLYSWAYLSKPYGYQGKVWVNVQVLEAARYHTYGFRFEGRYLHDDGSLAGYFGFSDVDFSTPGNYVAKSSLPAEWLTGAKRWVYSLSIISQSASSETLGTWTYDGAGPDLDQPDPEQPAPSPTAEGCDHIVAYSTTGDNQTDVSAVAVGKVDGSLWPLTVDMPVKYWDALARGADPAPGWQQYDYNDSAWSTAPGGYFVTDPSNQLYAPPRHDKFLTGGPNSGAPSPSGTGDYGSFAFTTALPSTYMTRRSSGSRPLYVRAPFTAPAGQYRTRMFYDNNVDLYVDGAHVFSSTSYGTTGVVGTFTCAHHSPPVRSRVSFQRR